MGRKRMGRQRSCGRRRNDSGESEYTAAFLSAHVGINSGVKYL
jgi:hypothetical protein